MAAQLTTPVIERAELSLPTSAEISAAMDTSVASGQLDWPECAGLELLLASGAAALPGFVDLFRDLGVPTGDEGPSCSELDDLIYLQWPDVAILAEKLPDEADRAALRLACLFAGYVPPTVSWTPGVWPINASGSPWSIPVLLAQVKPTLRWKAAAMFAKLSEEWIRC